MKKPSHGLWVALISWAIASSCMVSMVSGTRSTMRGIVLHDIPADIATAGAKLDMILAAFQQVPDVSDASVSDIVETLNVIIGKVNDASNAYSLGNNDTANATIKEALTLLDAVNIEVQGVIDRYHAQKTMDALLVVAGIVLVVVAITCLVFIARWRGKRVLDSFLATEIDYAPSKDARPGGYKVASRG